MALENLQNQNTAPEVKVEAAPASTKEAGETFEAATARLTEASKAEGNIVVANASHRLQVGAKAGV